MKFIFNSNKCSFKFVEMQTKSEKLNLKTASETGKSSEVVYGRFLNFLLMFRFFLTNQLQDYNYYVYALILTLITTKHNCVFTAQPHQSPKSNVQKTFCNGEFEVHFSAFVGMVFQ